MVGDLQHLGAQVALQQGPLLLLFRIAGEQDPVPTDRGEHHERVVVGIGAGAAELVHGAEHGQVHRAHLVCPADRRGLDRRVTGGGGPDHAGPSGGGLCVRRHDHAADRPAAEHPVEPADVVHVKVADHQYRHRRHAEPPQALVDTGRIGSRVDDHGAARRDGEYHRIALTDVAHDDDPSPRRPTGRHQPHRHGADDRRDGRDQHQPANHRLARGDQERHQQPREQQAAERPTRPGNQRVGHLRSPVRDRDQPARRPRGEPGRERRAVGPDRRQYGGEDPEDRRRRDRRRGEEVGRDGGHADRRGDRRDDRCTGGLRGGRHGERLGDPRRHATGTQRGGPARREEHQPGGREDREREPRVTGELRVDDDQHHNSGRQRRYRGPRAAGGQRDEREPAHGRGPQHAR